VSLAQERSHVDPSRIAEHGDEEVHAHLSLGDEHASLAEVDLELVARRCLEANRRNLSRTTSLSVRRDRPLQRAQLDCDPSLAEKLPRNDCIARRLAVE
jgi:hypothetical protein